MPAPPLFPIVLLPMALLVLSAAPHARAGQQSARPDLLASLIRKPDGALETRHLRLTVTATPDAIAPGSRVTLIADVVPKPGMHVYSPEQKDVIPVGLVLERDDRIRAGTRRFPPSERYYFAPLDETQRVYSSRFRIEQDVRVLDTPAVRRLAAADGVLTLTGHVRYQACDDAVCYLPQDVPVSWTVRLTRR